jgi:hypothetical protein
MRSFNKLVNFVVGILPFWFDIKRRKPSNVNVLYDLIIFNQPNETILYFSAVRRLNLSQQILVSICFSLRKLLVCVRDERVRKVNVEVCRCESYCID